MGFVTTTCYSKAIKGRGDSMIAYQARDNRMKTLVCLDSYHDGIPKGRIYTHFRETHAFESLSQFLLIMENLLDDQQMPQASTLARSFSPVQEEYENAECIDYFRRGSEATFEVRVVYRQHSSWQGVIIWLDRNLVQNFRSVLELIQLMDSALRTVKGSDSA